MNFLAPQWLWTLLAAIPLVAVYLLRVRPRRRPVTAYFLWQRILGQRKAASLFQRLRDALSLLLTLAALAAAVLAAAAPRLRQTDDRDLVIIVDASPSMRARGNGKPVVELARISVRDSIKALNGTRRMAVGLAAGELSFLSHLGDNPRDLLDTVDRIAATDTPVSAATIRSINAAAGSSQNRARFILLTDGARGWDELSDNIEVVRLVSGPLPNAGITAADLAWSGISGDKARFFYQVCSSFSEAKRIDLELRDAETDTLARLIPLNLVPGEPVSGTVELEGATPGRWIARLAASDVLTDDDSVALALPPRVPVKVAIPKADGYFFQRCVESFQAATGALALATGDAEISLCRGTAPAGASASVIFAPSGESPFWQSVGDVAPVLLTDRKQSGHPVLANLDFDALRFEGARQIAPSPGSMELAASESGIPLIWVSSANGRRAVVINLDPDEGSFFLSPWFPVLVHNAATYLAGRGNPPRSVLPTGSRADLTSAIPPGSDKPAGPQPVLETVGHWRTPDGTWFGAAVLSEPETVLDAKGPADSAKPLDHGHPPLVWLLVAAITLLTSEMFLYHRRKAG
ncbi:MAG: VWA domain-containing protein [Verrucomicrobia bacterium]|nr:VWA domain-containing protein [Verrucomicrobiota bacterium]